MHFINEKTSNVDIYIYRYTQTYKPALNGLLFYVIIDFTDRALKCYEMIIRQEMIHRPMIIIVWLIAILLKSMVTDNNRLHTEVQVQSAAVSLC